MRVAILTLVILCLIQSSIIPINLVYAFLIPYGFVSLKTSDYLLAFFAGIFIGILSSFNLGFYPIVFLISILIVHLARKLPISNTWISFLVLTIVLTFAFSFTNQVFFKEKIILSYNLIEIFLSFIVYLGLSRIYRVKLTTHTGKLKI